jgi:hypothetical protein
MGQSRRFDPLQATSGLSRSTDISRHVPLVRFVPKPSSKVNCPTPSQTDFLEVDPCWQGCGLVHNVEQADVVIRKTTSCRREFRATLSSPYVPLRAMAEGGDGGRRDDLDTRINSRVTMMAAATSATANPATTA